MDAWLRRTGGLLLWIAPSGALAYSLALYIANLLAWPANASVREWWGSELAIRYCLGFVRRGLLGQASWLVSGWLGRQADYSLVLSLLMAIATLGVGVALGTLLVRQCGWRLGLLILAAPAGWPVLLESAGATFRKDPLQILMGLLLLGLWRRGVRGRRPLQASLAWAALAGVEILAVLIHEPFSLLVLPTLAIAAFWTFRRLGAALLAITPGLLALGAVILHRGSALDVACLSQDLQRLGLLAPGEAPGSSIRELALARPAYFTLDLGSSELAWSLVHGLLMSLVVVLAYCLLLQRLNHGPTQSVPLLPALRLWLLQLTLALPVILTAVDYGRWIAMLFCSGLGLILICGSILRTSSELSPLQIPPAPCRGGLAALELTLLPSGCCTYALAQIVAVIPYAAASHWKALLLRWLAQS
ncbi:MAG: hypothetical protein ACKOZT_05485 [Cyanobium sp.]